MNKGFYKLVYSRVRHMLVAVADFASAHRTAPGARRPATRSHHAGSVPALRALVLAAMVLIGNVILSAPSIAQIVAVPGSGAQVIQTQNGLPQVNISRPSSAGVSVNNYSQFDVQRQGAILNNAATITQTQQAGYVNGNPNLTPGREARIIVNQVQSNSPSQLRGYLEVAGSRAEVVVANPQGILVDGAGFINTSRAVLTTGTPNFGPSGNLTGFNVTGGTITVQGAGLNVTNVDQVDLLSRAIQANAAIYANNLNVVAGANQIDHDTLNATPIAGAGPAPSVAIDVGALGGMYSNRIYLTSNEYGAVTLRGGSIANHGTVNAQTDLQVTGASLDNNGGTLHAANNVTVDAGAQLTNNGGTISAGQRAKLNARTLDNSGGTTQAAQLAITATNLANRAGVITQTGAGPMSVAVSGTLDNSNGGRLESNSTDLTLAPATLINDGGTITHAGNGTLIVDAGKQAAGPAESAESAGEHTAGGGDRRADGGDTDRQLCGWQEARGRSFGRSGHGG
ncbi:MULTISPECIES: filamentous hemagglutinin N-terminal domain-containing protein [Caballeronia]|uniref:Filamentous haemagglutinin FhaB/tRNA nuclease CdiA-like TPS domain-containing protein n=1 Tax=Caballeronia zhejiangensis TaxID=871203 RepID=A0A656QF80_9BURK|nr:MULTISPECIES: filamentous hemagglutinin N-terminal domain-containing protein [Caballeronia]KDR29092.1 hypothetical protein BG60_08300 [Caballeronia zhejiangensis]MDR5791036.1 filamentous hemagglutinin N-terminal domain-containing protein [Caballeronia sp. LP003]